MNSLALPLALLFGLTLALLATSLVSAVWMKRALCEASRRTEARLAESETAIEAVRAEFQACVRQIHEIRQEPPKAPYLPGAGPALNLSKRSQAIRMQRRGDSAEQIAATLGVPLQEIELLLRVHRIVIAAL